jgi:hypothetical protein
LQNKIGNLENLSINGDDSSPELSHLSHQLEQERQTNSKLNTDLAKSLELNLKLQFEIEEIRKKANQIIYKFQNEQSQWQSEKNNLTNMSNELRTLAEKRLDEINALTLELNNKNEETEKIAEALSSFESQSLEQQNLICNLSEVAERKIVELKIGLDKKMAESHDLNSRLQQATSQTLALKQENHALREYIGKYSALHQSSP